MESDSIKIYLYCCSNSFDIAELERRSSFKAGEIKGIQIPCSGKIDILYLTKAFETGADGVAIITCKQGECKYLEGNLRARKRVEAIDRLLKETGLGEGRITVIEKTAGGIDQLVREVEGLRVKIKALTKQAVNSEVKSRS
jgi:F420-non-reducing hydrogenase iron-sulfur subunit